ncbi:hypothetical protein X474_26955 [Dethiosulfatarculus sandiegensis]|uniref:Uncharacterized protein n=1 Tax=Dethiosulfatarculus sandiegensis TaxID=1429043 RepID=A0A0D2G7U7_9BACT|nr:hypothetical protein X474_26955 [Dethiosulfatarculus sandiegensis]
MSSLLLKSKSRASVNWLSDHPPTDGMNVHSDNNIANSPVNFQTAEKKLSQPGKGASRKLWDKITTHKKEPATAAPFGEPTRDFHE